MCVICYYRFAYTNGVEKPMEEKHVELWWDICNTLFRNKREVTNHMNQWKEIGMEVECNKCKKKLYVWDQKAQVPTY